MGSRSTFFQGRRGQPQDRPPRKYRGSIEVGKLADFVILDKNPLKIPGLELADLKVIETIKEGRTIDQAKGN